METNVVKIEYRNPKKGFTESRFDATGWRSHENLQMFEIIGEDNAWLIPFDVIKKITLPLIKREVEEEGEEEPED